MTYQYPGVYAGNKLQSSKTVEITQLNIMQLLLLLLTLFIYGYYY